MLKTLKTASHKCPKIAPKDQEIVLFIELSDVLPKIITAYEILNGSRLDEKIISKLTTVTFLNISGKDALTLLKKMKTIIAKSQNIMRLQNLFIWNWKHIASWLKDSERFLLMIERINSESVEP